LIELQRRIMAFLRVENISKSFGELKLFQDLSLDLEEGNIYTLIGANGSGKTTLFNLLTGFIKPEQGNIIFKDHILNYRTPFKINRIGIGRTFQDLRIINDFSVRENILFASENKMFNFSTSEHLIKSDNILRRISLLGLAEKKTSELSYGQKKLLTIGCCIANNPDLLLLDEPISGIDKDNMEMIQQIILNLKSEKKTILQIEHNLDYINRTSDSIFQITNRSLIRIKPPI
jgi:branched-chain amino acid transport system ATP-binding protein